MLIVGIVCLAVAIALAVFLVGDRAPVKAQPAALSAGGTLLGLGAGAAAPPLPVAADPNEPLPSVFTYFAAFARKLTPSGYARTLQHRLDVAGNPRDWAAERVLAIKGVGLVLGLLLGFLLGVKHGAWVLVSPEIGAVAGFFLPDVWINNLGQHRQDGLRLGLPDAIDMMTVCVEAGLGFDAALARVALNLEGPIAAECARVLQEMQFGKSRAEALRALVDRTDVPELRTFVSSLIQSSELGISMGDVLREQAREMRVKRRQRAEEKAQKLPVKILFPLLFCMLPSMFVIVVGPAAINVLKTLGGLNH